jgi:solute carrier family 25 phosphate transporter 23/24/25/41
VRLRLAVQPELKGTTDAFKSIWAEGGAKAYFKGLTPTLISLSPFIAINFATFDTLQDYVYGNTPREEQSKVYIPLSLVFFGLLSCVLIFAFCSYLSVTPTRCRRLCSA